MREFSTRRPASCSHRSQHAYLLHLRPAFHDTHHIDRQLVEEVRAHLASSLATVDLFLAS